MDSKTLSGLVEPLKMLREGGIRGGEPSKDSWAEAGTLKPWLVPGSEKLNQATKDDPLPLKARTALSRNQTLPSQAVFDRAVRRRVENRLKSKQVPLQRSESGGDLGGG